MSFNPLVCANCNTECVFEQIGLLPSEQNIAKVGISWKCPSCRNSSLDVCSLGPNVPQKNSCLNCGELYQENVCQECAFTKSQEEALFGYSSGEEAIKELYNTFNKGFVRKAFLVANYILREDLTNEEAWKFKAAGFSFLGLKQQRLDLFKDAVSSGAPLSLLISYGRALHEVSRFEEAVETYNKYLSSPNAEKRAVVLAHKANTLIALEKYQEAEKIFLEAIEADPKRVASYTDYTNLLSELKKWDEALEVVETLLKLPLTQEQINTLIEEKSYIYAELGKGEEALKFAEMVLESNAKSSRAHYLRGKALAFLGRLEEAKGEMKIVLELDSTSQDALEAIKMIENAMTKGKPTAWKVV